jgi:hypothetical protein
MGAKMNTNRFEELRDECDSALAWSWLDTQDMSPLLDDVFDIVTKAIRQHFHLGILEAELVLRDARNEADGLLEKYDLDDLVDTNEAVRAIAKHLAEKEEDEAEMAEAAEDDKPPPKPNLTLVK